MQSHSEVFVWEQVIAPPRLVNMMAFLTRLKPQRRTQSDIPSRHRAASDVLRPIVAGYLKGTEFLSKIGLSTFRQDCKVLEPCNHLPFAAVLPYKIMSDSFFHKRYAQWTILADGRIYH